MKADRCEHSVDTEDEINMCPELDVHCDGLQENWCTFKKERATLITSRDNIYNERNKLVQFLTKIYPSYRALHPDTEVWEDDWRNIIVVETPEGQLSWHIHDSETILFNYLPLKGNYKWDGHTMEEKYKRLSALNPCS
jgi:hypothetical protein